jgi:hypothetical protein
VFEPAVASQRSVRSIRSFKPAADCEGIVVENNSGSKQTIFSATDSTGEVVYDDKKFRGTYGVISETKGELHYLFLGNGRTISKGGYRITAKAGHVTAALCKENNEWFITCSGPVTVTMPHLKRAVDVPARSYTKILF